MSTAPLNSGAVAPASAISIDARKALRLGSLLALGLIFISLAGMPVGLNNRVVIAWSDTFGFLSMGYLALLWVPVAVGWASAHRVVLEGVEVDDQGIADVGMGAIVGAVGGAGLSLLVVMLDNFNIRDPLVNWSPQLLSFLNFDGGVGTGIWIWIPICAALGAVGAALRIMPARTRKVIMAALLGVLFVAVFETFVADLLSKLDDVAGLQEIEKFLYAKQGGLTVIASLVIMALVVIASISGLGTNIDNAKQTYRASTGNERTRYTASLIALSVVVLIIIPIITGKQTQELLANIGLFLLLALGLNIVVGLAGILDLGYVAFFAVGGYTTAVLTAPNRGESWPEWLPTLPWWAALLVTIVVAALVGLFIGAPVIRMRGDYLAIVTLGFGEIIRILFLSDALNGYFNGAQGITNVPPADFGFFEVKGTDPRSVFYLTLIFSAVAIYVSWRLERSRMGRAWMAIREDESVAEAMGINTVNMKLMAFVVGAILASFSGAIFAAKVGSIFPSSFLILVSIIILVVVIVGGMGNILGVIVGAVVLIGVLGGPKQPGLLAEFSEYKLLIYGALLIWMMLQKPEGLVPNVRRSRELHQDEFLQDAWLKGVVDGDDDDEPADATQGAQA